MKRLLIAILALIYLSTSAGATIHMHYCMGDLAGWGLSVNKSDTCPKCGMDKSEKKEDNCCSDEQKTFKNTSDQKTAEAYFQAVYLTAAALPAAVVEVTPVNVISITETNPVSNAPPLLSSLAIYIRNCVFLL